MGLDQYAFRLKGKPDKPVDFQIDELVVDYETDKLAYWRKHPDLQGFMETLYYMKGGKEDVFNCCPVLLEEADLDLLERKTRLRELPRTEGFFFGTSQYPEDDKATLEFIAKARKAIREGSYVAYDSWW